jgi:putative ABC transport system permease protein
VKRLARHSAKREGGRLSRWLLRLAPVREDLRDDVEADLHELYVQRRRDRGPVHAQWRLYHDLASLWFQPDPGSLDQRNSAGVRFALLRDALADLKYAMRLFARQPGILLLTIVGLSLGLGIATAAFSIMNAAALRGEGLVDSDHLPGVLRTTDRSVSTVWTYDDFLRLREGATRMNVEGVLTESVAIRKSVDDAAPASVEAAFVTGGFFTATGGRVSIGRPLEISDEQDIYRAGSPPVVVSFAFWTAKLNRDPAIIGRTIQIGRVAATVVGVAERGFSVPNNRLLWMPLTAYGAVYGAGGPARAPENGIQVFGRLLPNAALPEAEAQLSGVAAALPGAAAGESVRVRLDSHAGLGRVSSSDTLAVAVFVFAVIGLVLLLACANVATVLISTAITREREMGVRAALGASRRRIVRQLVTESLALGVVAAGIGLLLAYWTIPMIGTMIEAPVGADLSPDLRVYLFLGIVTLLTGVGAGLAPARYGRGADLVSPLKGEGARDNRIAPRRMRSLLVMSQAAISVLLIVMAALFVRATLRGAAIDVGYDATGLYAFSPDYGGAAQDAGTNTRTLWTRAISELQAVPGIASTTLVELTPFDGLTRSSVSGEGPSGVIVYFNRARANYFETIGLRLLAGRTFTSEEVAANSPVALVSQSVARTYWQDRSPLGQLLPVEIPVPPALTAAPGGTTLGPSTRPVVVGVVADAITARLHERNTLTVYQPLDPASEGFGQLMIRIAPGATGAVNLAVQRLRSIDPQREVRVTSVDARLQQEAIRPRMLAALTGVVGIIAIVLCVIGLYGLTASVVGQRAREMAVRAAMGADSRDLLRLLMWDSLRPVVLGLAIGAGAALLISRVVAAAAFFGVSPRDPVAFAGAAVVLLTAAILAVLVPTRRAAGVDASLVLRQS